MNTAPGRLEDDVRSRVTARAETGFSGNTDNQLGGAYGTVHVTNLILLVGWGFGIGPRL